MAKAKKPADAEAAAPTQPAADPAPKKKAGKAKGAAAKPAPAVAARPMVDTGLSAAAAAKALVAGLGPAAAGGSAGKSTSSFERLKESIANPSSSGGLGSLLDKTAPAGLKKPGTPSFAGPKQQGRNQTFGADVNRTGVPRRTGGG